jgi:hypothetical protein
MLGIAAIPWIAVGWFPSDWQALLGGTALLFIPQIVGWFLFVGLTTGRMPSARGSSELRTESPAWFWLAGGLYAGFLLFLLGMTVGVLLDGTTWGF